MRYIFVALSVCALGAPAASALPIANSLAAQTAQKVTPILQVAKKGKAQPRRQKSGATSGIHPLVGSGGY